MKIRGDPMTDKQFDAALESIKIIAELHKEHNTAEAINRIQTKLQTDKKKTAPEVTETVSLK